MTRRGAGLFLLPVTVIALGARFSPLIFLGLGFFILAAAAIWTDHLRAVGVRRGARIDELQVRRIHDDPLSIGIANQVELHVEDAVVLKPGTKALVRDEFPVGMRATHMLTPISLPGKITYTVTPVARGVGVFGRTVVRAFGPWNLAYRQSEFGRDHAVNVDPDMGAVRTYEALARRGQLEELGVRSLRRFSDGTEFARVREAVPDDPLRAINWKATARTGQLMATELTQERVQPVVICIDHGRLMGVGAGELTKLDHAVNAALLLTHVALRFGDRVGVMTFADRVTRAVTPRAGYSQMRQFINAVRVVQSTEIEADYGAAFSFFNHWQKRRALVVIFTDVIDADQENALLRQVLRLRRQHLTLVITVRDPAIEDLVRQSPQNARLMYARAVANGVLTQRANLVHTLQRSGIETLDADARVLSPRLVNRYMELKRRAQL